MVVERKLHTMINKNTVLRLLLCSEMCIMLRQHMAFLRAGFFLIEKTLVASLPVKFLKILDVLIPVVLALCWCLFLRETFILAKSVKV